MSLGGEDCYRPNQPPLRVSMCATFTNIYKWTWPAEEATWQIYDAKKAGLRSLCSSALHRGVRLSAFVPEGVVREGKLTTKMMSSIDSHPSASLELMLG